MKKIFQVAIVVALVAVGNLRSVALANPVPFVFQRLIPGATVPGGAGFALTVNGAGFVPDSVVNWNGNPRSTTFVNGTTLQAQISASDIAVAGTAVVTVDNPGPGG